MRMDFDKEKCLKLMKESEKLRQQGKLLWNYDKIKSKELTRHLTFLWDEIFWQNRNQYLQILESFISRKITVDEFMQQFGQLRRENKNASDMRQKNLEAEACGVLPKTSEIDFQLNPQSVGFTKIIGSIYSSIDLFNPDIDFDMNLKHPELIG